ncbi:hypothetical protein BDZ94DRAFT_1250712 [Collybia nuda]|uniref:F-box domain-containing protein n=1 Tax=Collybia nuda TaxID=64659 RepID=A0A9P5YCJ8_9AGAR|nr:hypothetical protein BDZ94DRAFT_1250712 [Collybia nuda]
MSFKLPRRRSLIPSQLPPIPPAPPLPPPVENICISQSPPMPLSNPRASGPTRLMRRVSSLFSSRKKRPPNLVSLPDAKVDIKWQAFDDAHSLTETEVSEDDIRRPSGLGRAVSISSNRSLPPSPFTAIDEESPFHTPPTAGFERARTMSSPNVLRSTPVKSRAKFARRSSFTAPLTKPRPSPISLIPTEILVTILSFLPRDSVVSLANTSRELCTAARITFYGLIDLRTIRSNRVESLITLLAFRRDLAEIVHTFKCHIWPSFFISSSNTQGIYSTLGSPQLTATFTVAFQNMHNLSTLLLPSFDHSFLRHHSAFGLRNLTFLNPSLSGPETIQLFTWLNGQTNITHLMFPLLVESPDTLAIPATIDTHHNDRYINNTLTDSLNTNGVFLTPSSKISPSCSPMTPSFAFTPSPQTPVTPFNSPNLLPSITTLHAPPIIFMSLLAAAPTIGPRPLRNVILNINTTLYTGLRPGALMHSLQGIVRLELRFGSAVDRRTIEKVLRAAGAALTGEGVDGHVLQDLQIELTESAANDDQVLKIITSVLSRYQGLLTLGLHVSSTPSTQEGNHPLQPSPLNSVLSEADEAQVDLWLKTCPSLRSITLLSGRKWYHPV